MKKITLFLSSLLSGLFLIVPPSSAQQQRNCGQFEAEERIKNEHSESYPRIIRDNEELEHYTQKYAARESNNRGTVYVIPVVFHIIHNNGKENISNEQVYDAVKRLNEDYRKLNSDTSTIFPAFKSISSDSEIEFRLAQKDPDGNCTNGIVRKVSEETYKGNDSWSISRWPRNKYLNIWVVNNIEMESAIGGGYIAGYTYRPGTVNSTPNIDGILIMHMHVGSIGTGSLDNSRTLTHEVGHWINLAHTWGNSNNAGDPNNCNDDDGVDDTPNTIGWFGTCSSSAISCGILNNIQNYMDYSSCPVMFTQGQSIRMRAALNSNLAERNNLWKSTNLSVTGAAGGNNLCKAEFVASRMEICEGETVHFSDASYNNPNKWNWSFDGASISSSVDKRPSVIYSTPGKYSVQLTVSDSISGETQTVNSYITVLPANGQVPSYMESFESIASLPDNNWFINNPDGKATWEIASVGASGSKSIKINNVNSTSGFNEISSTTIDLTSIPAVHISFKVAFAQKNPENDDELKFFASKNCGETWAMRWSRSGKDLSTAPVQTSNFIPEDETDWKEYTITNLPSSYLVSDFRFKFQFTGNGGNNIYIDDINIYDPATVAIIEHDQEQDDLKISPNPFKEELVISFTLNKDERIKLSVMDLLGKESVILPVKEFNSGEHSLKINKSDLNLSKGVYFIKMTMGDKIAVRKVVLN